MAEPLEWHVLRHRLTIYRDIVQDDKGEWVTVPGVECEVCGGGWPCEFAEKT